MAYFDIQNDIIVVMSIAVVLILGYIGIAACCNRGARTPVMVLCESVDDTATSYKAAFKRFAEDKMNLEINWVTKREQPGKCLLLCNVKTRIPEDILHVLQTLGIEGRKLDSDVMVVAMHSSSNGNKRFSNSIESPGNPKLANVFYSEKKPVKCYNNLKAKRAIESFLA